MASQPAKRLIAAAWSSLLLDALQAGDHRGFLPRPKPAGRASVAAARAAGHAGIVLSPEDARGRVDLVRARS